MEQKKNETVSTRNQAIAWWNSITYGKKQHLIIENLGHKRALTNLTGRELEEIYNKEVQEDYLDVAEAAKKLSNTVEELRKPNQKQLPKELEGVVPRIVTIEEKIKTVKANAKEFKQLDESLFKAYIFKFSDEDKEKCFEILMRNLDIQKAELINDGINLDLVFVKF